MPVARTLFHVHEEQMKNQFKSDYTKSILIGTLQTSKSPISMLHSLPHVFKEIFEYARPVPDKKDPSFWHEMSLPMCTGLQEDAKMEALENAITGDEGFGVLSNEMRPRSKRFLLKSFSLTYAWEKNDDGSFLNEGQLRQLWKRFAMARLCDFPDCRCRGLCCALIGDTVFWEFDVFEDAYRSWNVLAPYKYKPATQEELEERGCLQMERECLLVGHTRMARDDPSQLEYLEVDDDDGMQNI